MSTGKPLDGKVALVTGGGRGIGRSIVEHLAGLGCAVAIHGSRELGPSSYGEGTTLTDVAATVGDNYRVRSCRFLADLTEPDQAQALIDDVEQTIGPIDVFVHNAGGDIGTAGGKPNPNDCIDISASDVRAVIELNLLAAIFTSQAMAKRMVPRRDGRIITVSSTGAFIGRDNAAIYASAKAGAVHYMRCLAKQLQPHQITVNSIAPGETRTARFLATRQVAPERLERSTLDRIADIEEISRVVEFFAGPMGAFVSGQVLRVDGGGQCWPA